MSMGTACHLHQQHADRWGSGNHSGLEEHNLHRKEMEDGHYQLSTRRPSSKTPLTCERVIKNEMDVTKAKARPGQEVQVQGVEVHLKMMLVSEGCHVTLGRFAVQLQGRRLVVVLCGQSLLDVCRRLPDTCLGSSAFRLWVEGLGFRVKGAVHAAVRRQCTSFHTASGMGRIQTLQLAAQSGDKMPEQR